MRVISFLSALVLASGASLVARIAHDPPEVRALVPDRPAKPAANGPADPLPPGALARMGTTRFRHGGPVSSLAFLAQGKILASAGHVGEMWQEHTPGKIRLWEAETGKELRQFQLKGNAHLAASPNGTILAGADARDGTIFLWDAASGKELHRLKGGRPDPDYPLQKPIAFSPNGKILAVVPFSSEDELHMWDVETGRLLRSEKTGYDGKAVYTLAFSADGKILAYTYGTRHTPPRHLRLFEIDGWKEIFPLPDKQKGIGHFAFSPDKKTIAWAKQEDRPDGHNRLMMSIHDLATGNQIRRFPVHQQDVTILVFSADGKTLASASSDKTIRLWEAATGKERQVLSGDEYSARALAFAPDGKSLAWASPAGLIQVRNLASGEVLPRREGHQGMVSSVALCADGNTLISASTDGTIRIWETASGKELRRLTGHQVPVWGPGFHPRRLISSVRLSPDGKTLASVSTADETVRLWDLATGKEVKRFPGSKYQCEAAWLPDGKTLVVGGLGRSLHLYDIATGKELRNIREVDGGAVLVVSPDGNLLASGGTMLDLLETATGKKIPFAAEGFRRIYVSSAAFLPDGKTLLTGSKFVRTIHLSEIATGKELKQFSGHEAGVTCLALSPDGRTLASASLDETVRLWEVTTGKERRRFQGHQGTVTSLSWSGDGRTLASGSTDGTALVWDVYAK